MAKPRVDDLLADLLKTLQAAERLVRERETPYVDLVDDSSGRFVLVTEPSEDDSLHPPAPGDRPAHARAPEAVRPDLRLFDDEHEPEVEH